MTSEDLLTVRAVRYVALRPAHLDEETLNSWVGGLGFATLPDFGIWADQAVLLLETELARLHLVELWLWPGLLRYCAADLLGYVYAAVGDRHPRQDYRQQIQRGQLSVLAGEVYEHLLAAYVPLTASQVRDELGAERTSALVVEKALRELAKTLKLLRCGHAQGEALWRPLVLALPAVPPWVDKVSLVQAAAALVSQYLDSNVCETEEGLAAFFAPLFSRSRIHDAIIGLEAQRAIVLDNIDGRPAWRLK
ncbi:MAG: hypothetical protein ACRD1C_11470 [Terriglobales bacterium]